MITLICDTVRTSARVVYHCIEYLMRFVVPGRRSLRDEVVLITGAGLGLGRLMALRLAELGAIVVLWDVNEEAAQGVVKEIQAKGGRAYAYCVDVTDAELVYSTAKMVVQENGPVTILVNNAGLVTGKRLLDCSDDMIKRTIALNCTSHFWTVKAFLPAMLEANHGHIVTVASVAGLVGTPGLVDYSASKFAAVGFDESLRNELAAMGKNGVHTTCVCPYFTNTGMFEGAKTKFPWLLPILQPEYVANRIVDSIQRKNPMLIMPRVMYVNYLVRALFPTRAIDECGRFLGALESMDDFRGRQRA